MKRIFLSAALALSFIAANAQSDRYKSAMEKLIATLDTTKTVDGYTELGNSFQRVAEAEKTQWLPYYYAALASVSAANNMFVTGQTDKIDPIVDKAAPLIAKAEELQKDNSEIFILKKMYNTAKMMADPMNRYMELSPVAAEALATAKKLNPENPRVPLLEGQDLFFTPEQFGGDKNEAKKKFEEALKKFEAFKPADNLAPHWGKDQATYFISQIK
ncbi:hypothetical protein LZZ85_09550 [Terrimonas sp. NA20]|uniref:Uncharacterized protein n=1 Tax=Terrimonas ginsenosidimutans TaxID=2908004 RepID=A0ABS9KQB7_9BACT|nr:hypothetical protein [Terrimonas ginsenosidimutans]MCG2614526.1 hypothetical protein [Terrimonas ginsenosidimutans]